MAAIAGVPFVWQLTTRTPAQLAGLGRLMGELAPSGTVIALYGEMGAGKTLFSQGFAAGLGVSEHVTSPTFTIINGYESGRCPFYHLDLYRLADESEVEEIGLFECINAQSICLIEWAALVADDLPAERLVLEIEKEYLEDGGELRHLRLTAERALPWLVEVRKENVNFSD